MKIFCIILILYALPLYAHGECDYKLYIDSLHGFSMEIPQNQNIEKSKYYTYAYDARKHGNFQYRFFVELGEIFLSTLRENEILDPADTLLSMADNKCYFSLKYVGAAGTGGSYGRIDTLIQWTNNYDIRIIEIHRTRVIIDLDESLDYSTVGPLFLVKLTNTLGEIFLRFDFYNYYDYEAIKEIMSSINIIE